MKAALLSIGLLLSLPIPANTPESFHTDADVANAVKFAPQVGQPIPKDLVFNQSDGARELDTLVADKPTLITFTWFDCGNLCGLVLNALADAGGNSDLAAGEDFQVVAISMDTSATPAQARKRKQSLAARYSDVNIDKGWHLLTGSEKSIGALSQALGFHFVYVARKQQFAHPAGVIALDREGKITGFRAGINFRGEDIEKLVGNAGGLSSPTVAKPLLLLCFDYDPSSGRYSLAIMKVLRVLGVLTVLSLLAVVFYWYRREQRGNHE